MPDDVAETELFGHAPEYLTINKVIKGFLSKPMVALYFWMKLVK